MQLLIHHLLNKISRKDFYSRKKMFFFLVSCFSFLMLSQSLLKPHPNSSEAKCSMWAFPFMFLGTFQKKFMLLCRKRKKFTRVFQVPSEEVTEEEKNGSFLLDLPDLPLECILEKLPPLDLFSLSGVSSYMRQKCTGDHLWENHLKKKWGGVVGDAAYREWQCRISSARDRKPLHCKSSQSRFHLVSELFDLFGFRTPQIMEEGSGSRSSLPLNLVMSFCLALEAGKFWFPAQVFNRESGHIGFLLSCYDAHLSYDSTTDNFVARYIARGSSVIEEGIEWDRVRASSTIGTLANDVHVSDCLDELKPGDHIEIQWRRNKDFPYGWWYGVVGHLDSCLANQFNCQCHIKDTLIMEFKQYSRGSRWRKTMIGRKDHREVGNEADGFYGGIRKLYKEEEIAKWNVLQPNCTLE